MELFGGIISVDRPLLKNVKAAALIIYTGFAVINLLVMISPYIKKYLLSHK